MTKEQIIKEIKEKKIEFIRLQFTDILGSLKSVTITKSGIEKALDGGCMFDGSSIEGFVRVEESDMFLRPDLHSFRILPETDATARLICDAYTTEGKPFLGDPRGVLRRVLEDAKKQGFLVNAGPECEFFLFDKDKFSRPTLLSDDKGGYFDVSPVGEGGGCRREICKVLESMGFIVESSHHEVAPAQHEIDFRYSDALTAADNILTFKMVVRLVAKKFGLHATFMPKPKRGIAGSGMHLNLSLVNVSNKKNAFYSKADKLGLSETAYSFIAGVLERATEFTAITNPLVNSYKRLVSGYEAPSLVCFSAKNRSSLVRVPYSKESGSTRIELRSPDPSCNSYLAMAVVIASGLDGIKRGLKPPMPVDGNIYDLTEKEKDALNIASLPNDLLLAVNNLERSEFLKNVLGEHIFKVFIDAKRKEYADYSLDISKWEIENYLAKY